MAESKGLAALMAATSYKATWILVLPLSTDHNDTNVVED